MLAQLIGQNRRTSGGRVFRNGHVERRRGAVLHQPVRGGLAAPLTVALVLAVGMSILTASASAARYDTRFSSPARSITFSPAGSGATSPTTSDAASSSRRAPPAALLAEPGGSHYFPFLLQRYPLLAWIAVEPHQGAVVPVGRSRWMSVTVSDLPAPVYATALIRFNPRVLAVVDESPEPGHQILRGDLAARDSGWRHAAVDNRRGSMWLVDEVLGRGPVSGMLFRFRVRGLSAGSSQFTLQPDLWAGDYQLGPALRSRGARVEVVPPEPPALPAICPGTPARGYGSLQVLSRPSDRPAQHPDLNLALRGYVPCGAFPGLVDHLGDTDPRAPQLAGLLPVAFSPGAPVRFDTVWQVRHWNWSTNSRGPPIRDWPATLVGVDVPPGSTVHVPDSGYEIGEGQEVLVLYAARDRITLKYTREDDVVGGYALHVEGVCVDPRLQSLYEQLNRKGRHRLPALTAGQPFGTAFGEVRFAIRDAGSFMDPRSRKDWWRGYR